MTKVKQEVVEAILKVEGHCAAAEELAAAVSKKMICCPPSDQPALAEAVLQVLKDFSPV